MAASSYFRIVGPADPTLRLIFARVESCDLAVRAEIAPDDYYGSVWSTSHDKVLHSVVVSCPRSMGSSVCHIVPATPPEFNGLGDYCYQLWKNWPEPKLSWDVLSLRATPGSALAWPEASIRGFEPSFEGLSTALDGLEGRDIVLHYVPHAYQPKGVPNWLPKALARAKARNSDLRLVVMFHELFAVSPPWKSAFWLAPFSIQVLRSVALLADSTITSNELYARQLKVYAGLAKPAAVQPVGANIGSGRQGVFKTLVPGKTISVATFGMPKTRYEAYQRNLHFLHGLLGLGYKVELVILGKTDEKWKFSETVSHEKFSLRDGAGLSDAGLSDTLAECDFGLSNVEPSRVGKSGVLSAYCAHGVVPVLAHDSAHKGPYLAFGQSEQPAVLGQLLHPSQWDSLIQRVTLHADRCQWANAVEVFSNALQRDSRK